MSALQLAHALISLLIALLVPVTVYFVTGRAGAEIVVLGVAVGFAYWYWGPSWPPI